MLRAIGNAGLRAALLLCAAAAAAQDGASAYDVVEEATGRVMAVVADAPAYIEEDPQRYYRELQAILDEVVDFGGFARGVMGRFATRAHLQSLDSQAQATLREQVRQFTQIMRVGLVRTYGKGLLAFGDSRVEVRRPPEGGGDAGKATVTQLIHRDAGEPYVIHYQMRRGAAGQWKLRNLIVESVNLGQVYRNQFQAAARDAEGDLASVIDNWATWEAQ